MVFEISRKAVWLLQVCFADSFRLVVESAFTNNSRKPGTWLIWILWSNVIKGLRLDKIVQESLFLLTVEAGTINA